MYHVTQKLQEIKHAYGSLFCIYYKKNQQFSEFYDAFSNFLRNQD